MSDGTDVADRLESIEEDLEGLEDRVNRLGKAYAGVDRLREKVDALESLVQANL